MLSKQEKKEMLEDAKSEIRRQHFQAGRRVKAEGVSLDEYLNFLEQVQKIFGPFPLSKKKTISTFNKL